MHEERGKCGHRHERTNAAAALGDFEIKAAVERPDRGAGGLDLHADERGQRVADGADQNLERHGALHEPADGDHEKQKGAGKKQDARSRQAPQIRDRPEENAGQRKNRDARLEGARAEHEAADPQRDEPQPGIPRHLAHRREFIPMVPKQKERDRQHERGVFLIVFRVPRLPRPLGGALGAVDEDFEESEKIDQGDNASGSQQRRSRISATPPQQATWRFGEGKRGAGERSAGSDHSIDSNGRLPRCNCRGSLSRLKWRSAENIVLVSLV